MFKMEKVASAAAISLVLFSGVALAGETVKIKDITGREVEVSVPVERVILGEGRQIYFTQRSTPTIRSVVSSAGAMTSRRPISTATTST